MMSQLNYVTVAYVLQVSCLTVGGSLTILQIISVLRERRLLTLINCLVIYKVCACLLGTLICTAAMPEISHLDESWSSCWRNRVCVMFNSCLIACLYVSASAICTISLVRYLMVVKNRVFYLTWKTCVRWLGPSVTITTVVTVCRTVWRTLVEKEYCSFLLYVNDRDNSTSHYFPEHGGSPMTVFFVTLHVVVLSSMFFLQCFFYVSIAWTVKRSRKNLKKHGCVGNNPAAKPKKQIDIVTTIIAVVHSVLFAIAFILPSTIYLIIKLTEEDEGPILIAGFLSVFVCLTVNPIISIIGSRDYRQALWKTMVLLVPIFARPEAAKEGSDDKENDSNQLAIPRSPTAQAPEDTTTCEDSKPTTSKSLA